SVVETTDLSSPTLCTRLRNGSVSIYAIGLVGERFLLYTSTGHLLNLPLRQFNFDVNYLELDADYEPTKINSSSSLTQDAFPKDSHRLYFIAKNAANGEPLLMLIYD